jgi:plastocyanin
MRITVANFALLAACLMFTSGTQVIAQEKTARVAQIVALDECDPSSFNMVLGADFCKNVALSVLGFSTTFPDLFTEAANGMPDPGWDFEPDTLTVSRGTTLLVTDQGGEPHTFTEVKKFGGGFVTGLNDGQETVPECAGGFKNVKVARTRILQGSTTAITDLSEGEHHFECCIHPWMRVTVKVK